MNKAKTKTLVLTTLTAMVLMGFIGSSEAQTRRNPNSRHPRPVVAVQPVPLQAQYGVAEWCNSVVMQLQQAKMMASNQLRYGNYRGVNAIYISTLTQLANSAAVNATKPITVNAILNVLNTAQQIQGRTGDGALAAKSLAIFVEAGVEHVIDIALNVDIPYVIPCGYGCGSSYPYPGNINVMDYEAALMSATAKFLDIVLDQLVTNYNGLTYPIGSTQLFLAALKNAAIAVENTLNNSPFRHVYACLIMQAGSLISQIEQTQMNPRSIYPNEVLAVQALYQQANNLRTAISGQRHCGSYGY